MGIGRACRIDSLHAFQSIVLELKDRSTEFWMLVDNLLEEVIGLTVGSDIILFQTCRLSDIPKFLVLKG